MEQEWQGPNEIKMVPGETIPELLFVCLAKIKPEAGVALKSIFETGNDLPHDLKSLHEQHLLYTYDLSQKGSYWEAGPATDFSEILYVFSTSSLETAQGLMYHDPFYQAGIFYDDWWFEWQVHTPSWKLAAPEREMMENLTRDIGFLPKYPPGVRPLVTEIKIEVVTPPALFVSLAKTDTAGIKKVEQDHKAGKPVPAFLMHHFANRLGPGGTTPMGYDWESGPSSDSRFDLTIMSVNSLQMAQQLRENDHFAIHGLFYDHRYFKWCILMPLRKASPSYKETLKRLLKEAGVKPAD